MFKCREAELPEEMTEFCSGNMRKTLIFILNSVTSTCPLQCLYFLISGLQITLNIKNIKLSELVS